MLAPVLCLSHLSNPNLLELSARPWLYELGVKRLSDVPDSVLEGFVAKGIDSIYLLGVWELGEYGVAMDKANIDNYRSTLPDITEDDVIGSCFAVVDYTMNEKEIGTNDDLKKFRERLHKLGLMLYLDFVPNHSAVDAVQATAHPEYYVKDTFRDASQQYENGIYYGKDKYGNYWRDTLQYNIFNPATVEARIADLMTVASYADGIRCDMAMLLLNDEFSQIWGSIVYPQGYAKPSTEFWKTAIQKVKAKYPDVKFMAEVYWNDGDKLMSLGFDYVYDKEGLYDTLRSGHLDNIRSYIANRGQKLYQGAHFIENHDEGRAAAAFGSNTVANAAGLVTFTLPGLRFHFDGQWLGRKNKLDVHLRRTYQPEKDQDQATIALYDKFLPILKDNVWHKGDWEQVNVQGTGDSWRLMGWTYDDGSQRVLVVVNYSDTQGTGKIKLSNVGSGTISFTEKLSGEVYERDGAEVRNDGLFVIIGAWDA